MCQSRTYWLMFRDSLRFYTREKISQGFNQWKIGENNPTITQWWECIFKEHSMKFHSMSPRSNRLEELDLRYCMDIQQIEYWTWLMLSHRHRHVFYTQNSVEYPLMPYWLISLIRLLENAYFLSLKLTIT